MKVKLTIRPVAGRNTYFAFFPSLLPFLFTRLNQFIKVAYNQFGLILQQ